MLLLPGGDEATNTEKMEALYASVLSWGTEEEDNIPFPPWNGVYEYRDPVYPTSLSAKLVSVFPEVASLLNSRVEQTVILNEITQYNNKVLVYYINKTVKFHRMERIMEEAVSTFQSAVDA